MTVGETNTMEALIADNDLTPVQAAAFRAWRYALPQRDGDPMPAAVALDMVTDATGGDVVVAAGLLHEAAAQWLAGEIPFDRPFAVRHNIAVAVCAHLSGESASFSLARVGLGELHEHLKYATDTMSHFYRDWAVTAMRTIHLCETFAAGAC
jgi:hypothetical protein